MQKTAFVLLFALFFVCVSAQGSGTEKEKEAIKKVIQTSYVEGLLNEGNLDKVEKGFHPCFTLLGQAKGNRIWTLPLFTWKEQVREGLAEGKFPAPDDKKVTIKFDWVDIEGATAVAKFKFYSGGKLLYTDYHSLYKFRDGWKIVHKIYARQK